MLGIYAKESREAMGLSLLAVSKRTRIPAQRLRRIEAGLSPLKPETIGVLQSALDLSDKKLESMVEIARIGFINEFMELSWAGGES